VFQGGGRTTVVRLQGDASRAAAVAVTIEREGGVDAPTTPPILSARL
jgi:hypothetical protein